MLSDVVILAFKNVRKRGLRSWLTLLGIIIGITAVIALLSLGQGLQEAITGQFTALSADRLIVQNGEGFDPLGSAVVKKLTEHDKKLLESIQGVKQVIPRLVRPAKVEYNDRVIFGLLGSMPETKEQMQFLYETFSLKAASGKLLETSDRGKVLMGHSFRGKENVFGKELLPGSRIKIQEQTFEVAGVLQEISSLQFNQLILVPEKDMRAALGIGDEIDLLVVQVKDNILTERVAQEIERTMRKDRNLKEGEEDFSVQTPQQFLSAINTILLMVRLVIVGIAAISLLVGGIGIANTMFTSVLERTREIGVMKAVGARNRDILLLFLIESGMLGFVGGILGAALGSGIAFLTASAVNAALGAVLFKVQVVWSLVLGAVGFACIIGMLAGMLPAFQAARLHPVETLRQ